MSAACALLPGSMILFQTLVVGSLLVLGHGSQFPSLDKLQPSTSPGTQARAVGDLIARLIGSRATDFKVVVDPQQAEDFKDAFTLVSEGSTLTITGSSGVAAAWGFYYYISQYCDAHISWAGDQVDLPSPLPPVTTPTKVTANDRFRYYQNVCTVSYSFAWWDWSRWEKEIDWMVMSAINLPLAFNAQEAIWQRVYTKMGFTEEELNEHFGGPAFLAWARMGNLRGWGGPLTSSWHSQQVALQHRILTRMRELGMIPVLPAFAGHVPRAISRLYPKAQVSRLGDWGNFNDTYCCTTLLDINEPLFQTIGGAFIKEYTSEFGSDHVYNTDTFNEMTPKSNDTGYLMSAGQAVFNGMLAGDPDAVWLMQGWLFLSSFWHPPQAQALLTSVPLGRMIVLDLYSEVSPQYTRLQSYYGQPFIWCMLHNFGGTVPMYGVIDRVNEGPFEGRTMTNSSMVGVGLTPEGINQNNVIYEFMMENTWQTKPRNISLWMSHYARRRYGKTNEQASQAWQLLGASIYDCRTGYNDHGYDAVVVARPRTDLSPAVSAVCCVQGGVYKGKGGYNDQAVIPVAFPALSRPIVPDIWYDVNTFFSAWDYMTMASHDLDNDLFRYDLVDVTRQALQIISTHFYDDMLSAYKAGNRTSLIENGSKLLNLLSDMDAILGTDKHFLLGRWIAAARSLGTNDMEKNLLEYNARNQITLWGPTGNIRDYANKQWSGLIYGYYRPRWSLFVLSLFQALSDNTTFNESLYQQMVFDRVEQPFTIDHTPYPTNTTGDQLVMSRAMHDKYRPHTIQHRRYFSQLREKSSKQRKPSRGSSRWEEDFYRRRSGVVVTS